METSKIATDYIHMEMRGTEESLSRKISTSYHCRKGDTKPQQGRESEIRMSEVPASSPGGFKCECIKSSNQTTETGKVDRQPRVQLFAACKGLMVRGHTKVKDQEGVFLTSTNRMGRRSPSGKSFESESCLKRIIGTIKTFKLVKGSVQKVDVTARGLGT